MAYRDSTTGSGNSTTPAVAVPAGVAANDIVLLIATFDAAAAAFDPGDWPTGFTELDETDVTLDGQSMAVGWKRLTGADSGSYTFGPVNAGASEWICQAIAFSGRHLTNPPVNGTVAVQNTGQNTPVTVTANGVTALDGDDVCWISAPDVLDTGIGNGHTPPTNFIEAEDAENGFCNLSIAYREAVSAGATGSVAGTFAHTSGSNRAGWASWLIRLPAAAGGGAGDTQEWLSHAAPRRMSTVNVSY